MPVQSAPITLQEAERVWKSQARPSARSVARALTQAGRPVHFTTVARWKRQGLLTIARTSESAEPEASPENLSAELPPPVSPLEAKRVWDEQRRPSSRSGVAEALTQAGRSIHFTTVARWKRREWQVEARLEHPLAGAMRVGGRGGGGCDRRREVRGAWGPPLSATGDEAPGMAFWRRRISLPRSSAAMSGSFRLGPPPMSATACLFGR